MKNVVSGVFAAALILADNASAQDYGVAIPVQSADIRIFDGDTIRLKGDPVSIRLVGFNTPEISCRSAACTAEID